MKARVRRRVQSIRKREILIALQKVALLAGKVDLSFKELNFFRGRKSSKNRDRDREVSTIELKINVMRYKY